MVDMISDELLISAALKDVYRCAEHQRYVNKFIRQVNDFDTGGVIFEKIRLMRAKHFLMEPIKKCFIHRDDENELLRKERVLSTLAVALWERSYAPLTLSVAEFDRLVAIMGLTQTKFFFIKHDPTFVGAVLDQPVLQWMRKEGYGYIEPDHCGIVDEVKYQFLEEMFIMEADQRELTCAELDTVITSHKGDKPYDS